MVRLPGIEPGPSRWQRDIITTRLKAHISEGRYLISDCFVSPQGLRAPKKLLVGESNPGRLRDRQKCYQLHQRGEEGTTGIEPVTAGSAIPCSTAELSTLLRMGARGRTRPGTDPGAPAAGAKK